MLYSDKDYVFLGKQVAAGRYVSRSVFALSLALVLLAGLGLGRYVNPDRSGFMPGADGQKRPMGEKSAMTADAPGKRVFDAILRHEEELRRNPKNAESWEHLGNLYYDANEPVKAINAYLRVLELNPGNTSVLVDCGVMYRTLRQYDKALEFFSKALTIDPRHEFALFNSGIVLYHDLGRKDEALKAWRDLVTINPNARDSSGELVSDMIKIQ
jgi:tetratricopeptide (TPR) repeat protein